MQLAHALRERTVAKLLGEGVCCRRHRRGIIQQQVARLSTSEIFEKRGPRAMSPVKSCTIGFPRIGDQRQMKKALESYWKGGIKLEELLSVSTATDEAAWKLQASSGIDLVGLDGTLYDQLLDWIVYLGLEPERFKGLEGYDKYFAMARGVEDVGALDMSKYFDTNYHYLMPELNSSSSPNANFGPFLDKVKRGQAAIGKESAIPIIIGPNTLVGLAKGDNKGTYDPSALIRKLVPTYMSLMEQLKSMGVPEVQVHEPILVTPDSSSLKSAVEHTFAELSKAGVPINLVTFYDDLGFNYEWVVKLPVQAISLDFLGVPGSAAGNATAELISKHGFPKDKRLGAGIIDGRSVYGDHSGGGADLASALLAQGIENLAIQSSVSLQHVPYDKDLEKSLPKEVMPRLSFAKQKVEEMVALAKSAKADKSKKLQLPAVGDPTTDVDKAKFNRAEAFEQRRPKQYNNEPFATTTIGSFPQTPEIRRARLQWKKGQMSDAEYEKNVNEYMEYAIKEQEQMGMDVLVHGEPERTDMVEYFGVKLEGFCFTEAGWVQSYGSRYVRPPIIYADITRPAAMTVKEFQYAQSLTKKPVKGMLTGPVTILNWSFPRKDISRRAQAVQLGLALRDEVSDLEKAGCRVIQVDEPALREGLPLKSERWQSYLTWAVDAFKLATTVAQPSTQIVTHLCYSEFADILEAIDGLDADVLTIENSRSGDEMITALAKYGYKRDIGPGVYDVHSPVVPSAEAMLKKLQSFLPALGKGYDTHRMWVNPDCGLKTREWSQVLPALKNMIDAASKLRSQ